MATEGPPHQCALDAAPVQHFLRDPRIVQIAALWEIEDDDSGDAMRIKEGEGWVAQFRGPTNIHEEGRYWVGP